MAEFPWRRRKVSVTINVNNIYGPGDVTSRYSKCDSMNYFQLQWTTFSCISSDTPHLENVAVVALTKMKKRQNFWVQMCVSLEQSHWVLTATYSCLRFYTLLLHHLLFPLALSGLCPGCCRIWKTPFKYAVYNKCKCRIIFLNKIRWIILLIFIW